MQRVSRRCTQVRPQGLGTGSLFTNNFDSPLEVKNGTLQYNTNLDWNISSLIP